MITDFQYTADRVELIAAGTGFQDHAVAVAREFLRRAIVDHAVFLDEEIRLINLDIGGQRHRQAEQVIADREGGLAAQRASHGGAKIVEPFVDRRR